MALISLFFMTCMLLNLSAAYTFTDKKGRTLEAAIISVSDSKVKIRRSYDGQIFSLNIKQLIPEDIAFLKEWSSGETNTEPQSTTVKDEIGDWPRKIKPENYDVMIVSEDNKAETYIYQTPHFEFHSNVKLARKVVREFSQIFESTLLAVSALPLQLNPELPENKYFFTQIFETEEDYLAAGGIQNSAGMYTPRNRKIMLPLRHLGVKKASSTYTLDGDQKVHVLAHEITHQVMHDWLDKLPIWFIEGIAEYIEAVPYERGTFRFDRYEVDEALQQDHCRLVHLEVLMNMDYQEWMQILSYDLNDAASNYLSAFMLFYYFAHLELDKDNKPRLLHKYLRVVESGERVAADKILLNGRSYEELEETIRRAYRREGIDMEFL